MTFHDMKDTEQDIPKLKKVHFGTSGNTSIQPRINSDTYYVLYISFSLQQNHWIVQKYRKTQIEKRNSLSENADIWKNDLL